MPSISKVDAGTVELIQKAGAKVVSSADMLQHYTSVWTSDQLQMHVAAAQVLEETVELTWIFIKESLCQGTPLDEYRVQQFMLKAIHEAGCYTESLPICAINAHSADPHYCPTRHQTSSIQVGDFILLDLWCKQKTINAVYADITRVGVAGHQPNRRQVEIFKIVKEAQNLATRTIQEHHERNQSLQGWQVDQVCRSFIERAGFGDYFIHRTGHNIGEEVHGLGANLDNLETHDYRQLLTGTCFSIEPGIYLPCEFGIRLEYNIYLDPKGSIRITGGSQEELICLKI